MADERDVAMEPKAPNGGWGWLVAWGSFLVLGMLSIMSSCYSILFSGFLQDHGASSTTIAWIFNAHIFLWNVMGLLTGPLIKEFGFRRISFLNAAVACLTLMSIAFASSIWYLLVFFSLCGMFGGLACKPCYLQVAQYFDSRRGQANAILMSGACTGQFVGPPLVRYLLEQYSFTGATLIIGAILLNSCVGAALFQPVEWHMKKPGHVEKPLLAGTADVDAEQGRVMGKVLQEDEDTNKTLEPKRGTCEFERRMLSGNINRRVSRVSAGSNLSLAVSYIDLTGLTPNTEVKTDTTWTGKDSSNSNAPEERGVLKMLARLVRGTISDLAILKTPTGFIIAFGGVFAINSYLNFLITAPFAIQHAGFSLEDAAWCMSVSAVANLVTRLTTSSLSDNSWFNMKIVYMLGAAVMAVSILLFSFLTDLTWMMVTLGVWGVGVGINISLFILVMPKFMGLEKMTSIFGAQSFALAFGNLILGPLVGLIRDVSDSYAVAMWVMSAESFILILLWLFMPAAVAYEKKKEALQEAYTITEKPTA